MGIASTCEDIDAAIASDGSDTGDALTDVIEHQTLVKLQRQAVKPHHAAVIAENRYVSGD